MTLGQHPRQFVTHALPRNYPDLTRERLHRGKCGRFDLIFKSRSEAHRPQHAQLVFGESPLRLTNRADNSSGKIVASSDIVKDLSADGIKHHAIDREVSAHHILAPVLAESHCVRMSPIGISNIAAE